MDSLCIASLCPLLWEPHLPEGQQLWVIDYILGVLVVATLEPRVLQALFFFLHHRGVSMSLCLTLVSSQKETSNLSASKFSGRFWLTPADLSIHSSFPRVSLRTTADFVSPHSCESSIPLVDPTLGTLDFDFCPGSWTCQ